MTPSFRVLAAVCAFGPVGLVALGAAPVADASQAQASRWWKSEPIVSELVLTAEQSARIDQIWESTVPELREEWEQLDHLEAKLARMIEESIDEAQLGRQIDRVETARANANKTRSLMLYRMRQVLTPEQRVRLKVIQQRRASRNGQSPSPATGGSHTSSDESKAVRRLPEF
jgi:Spy/CpxP family protein refolding chaperone